MRQGISEKHFSDESNRPEGGHTWGTGFAIAWQRGPLGRGGNREQPNGAFVEDVLAAVIGRIEFYEKSEFACTENKVALTNLRAAAEALDSRTKARESRAVEGTYSK